MISKSTIGTFVVMVAAGIAARFVYERFIAPRIPETI